MGQPGKHGMLREELVSPTIEGHRALEKQYWAAAGFRTGAAGREEDSP
jgi:hypothetical protein